MANKWISHVKDYAKEHNVSYSEALKKARATYAPSKAPSKKAASKHKSIAHRAYMPSAKYGGSLKDWGLAQYDKIPDSMKPGLESAAVAGFHELGFGLKKKRTKKMSGGDLLDDIKRVFKPVAKEIVNFGVQGAGPAAAAAASAIGAPELAVPVAMIASQLAKQAQPELNKSIDGLGLKRRKHRKTKGRALMPAGAY